MAFRQAKITSGVKEGWASRKLLETLYIRNWDLPGPLGPHRQAAHGRRHYDCQHRPVHRRPSSGARRQEGSLVSPATINHDLPHIKAARAATLPGHPGVAAAGRATTGGRRGHAAAGADQPGRSCSARPPAPAQRAAAEQHQSDEALARAFKRTSGVEHSGERLMRELLRLRKHGQLPRLRV